MSYSNAISSTHPVQSAGTTAVQKTTSSDTDSSDKTAAQGNPVQGDSTSISPTSTQIASALSTSDVRADKVASLQQAIAAGTYNVSSSDVADKLLTSLLKE